MWNYLAKLTCQSRVAFAFCAIQVFGFGLSTCNAAGEELDVRLRITWGEATQHHWNGILQLSDGTFSEIRRLGFEANAPTAVVNQGSALTIWQPAPVVFDGVDVRVTASDTATLTVVLQRDRKPENEETVTLKLSDFVGNLQHTASSLLDDQGNRLSVRRAPGDHLRVTSNRDSFVFFPGETWSFDVQPYRLTPNAELRCTLQLVDTRSRDELWAEQFDVDTDATGSFPSKRPFSVTLPTVEGPCELVATLRERKFTAPLLMQSFRDRRISLPIVYQRKVQIVVIDPNPAPIDQAEWREVDDVQPGNAKWWERWSWLPQLKLTGESHGPLDNGLVSLRQHLGQQLTELAPNGWQAAPLPISRIGAPHLLELEYPNDSPQTLAISVIETNAAGMVTPLGLDSGVDVVRSPTPATPGMEKHRLIFWPKTKTPWLLLSNRRDGKPAAFGKIRVLAGPTSLPPAAIDPTNTETRQLAAYYEKPLFPENFSAPETLDETTQQSLGDWNTFYTGGLRLVEYLKHVGYSSAIISISRDGATIYPSRLLESTPRYDSGALFVSGQDLAQKDVLEMLFRLFDREQLQLIPSFHFATPLLELEALQQRNAAAATGIELIGYDGRSWAARFGTNRGQAPYYNPLDSRVQNAIRHVIDEVVGRYSHHRSFAGVSLQMGPDTFVQMPGTAWGNDDRTIARFKADTNHEVPGDGQTRHRDRATFLNGVGRKIWLDWRAQELAEFYGDIQSDIVRSRPDAKLYLATSGLLASALMRDELQPRLPLRNDFSDTMMQLGLSAKLLQKDIKIVPMRPQRIKPRTALADLAVDLQLRDSPSVDAIFEGDAFASSINYYEPLTFALPSFDAVSPFGPEVTRTWFASHIPSNGFHARAQFTHNVAALDAQLVAEGGWMIPLGQEDSLRKQFAAFRQLPAQRFETVKAASQEAQTSSLVIRTHVVDERTYFYIVNNAPWAATADIDLELSSGGVIQRFGSETPEQPRTVNSGQIWTVELEPYDLVAGYCTGGSFMVVDWRVRFDRIVTAELTALVQEVKSRVNELRSREPLKVIANSGFERMSSTGDPVDWIHANGSGMTIEVSDKESRTGTQSLHMKVTDPKKIAWIRNREFPAPKTGRLSLLAWVRTKDQSSQPQLRMAIDNGRGYYTFATLGKDVDGQAVSERLGNAWPAEPYLFHCDTLPTDLENVSIGFDLVGEGEVWIDDVEVYDLYFFDTELNELIKNVATAHFQLEDGRVADCERFLDGYWPRFVIEHVPPNRVAQLPRANPPERSATPGPSQPTAPPEDKPSGFRRYIPSLPFKLPFSS
ncbi:MAG: family 10 glycosylhydrolase [Planctomycetaceae bacterium]|nr:family 10 glycosylhydrolase [Planctomycetales bacterium]MCB9921776.1 family 10 glycosylhydrolase [Planctomycetaceae bacterium]